MFIATIPAVMYVDKLGRKPVMIVGGTGMFLCHFAIAVIFAKNQHQWETHKAAGWAAVALVWLFVINFGYSWGPCAWVIISEVWPLSNRAYGIALGASANWMSNFIVGQITPDMIEHLTYGTFIFFGLLTTGGVIFVWLVVPETKRLSLEEMDVIFGTQGVAEAVSIVAHETSIYTDVLQDSERLAEISHEIGLDTVLGRLGIGADQTEKSTDSPSGGNSDGDKTIVEEREGQHL